MCFVVFSADGSEAFLSNGMDQQDANDRHHMEATVQARGTHQPHLRRSDQQHKALGKQGHKEQRNTDQ
jgi:hypothetical protein